MQPSKSRSNRIDGFYNKIEETRELEAALVQGLFSHTVKQGLRPVLADFITTLPTGKEAPFLVWELPDTADHS